jgi:uncharacterized membrane protein YfcA
MQAWVGLTEGDFVIVALITFAAGMVRGFAGFALSALVMATAVLILPPVELIPMLWWLEMTASLMMLKGGIADAHRPTAYALVAGSAAGWPIGLYLTTTLPVETSKIIALCIIISLSSLQLARLRLGFLNSRPGLYGTGLVAGVVSGLANVGGMVVALYVLASDAPVRQMRGSLVLFLFLGALTSMLTLTLFGVMDLSGIRRGLVFALPTAMGVYLGQRLFTPRYERWYRPFCLTLLLALAGAGLARTILQ